MREIFKRQITVVFEAGSNYESTLSDDSIRRDLEGVLDFSINDYNVISIKDYVEDSENREEKRSEIRKVFKRQIAVVFDVESYYEHAITDGFIRHDLEEALDFSINKYNVISIKDYEGGQ